RRRIMGVRRTLRSVCRGRNSEISMAGAEHFCEEPGFDPPTKNRCRQRAIRLTLIHLMNLPAPQKRRSLWFRATVSSLLLIICVTVRGADQAQLRAGMIGLDTSHVTAFAKIFNNPKA